MPLKSDLKKRIMSYMLYKGYIGGESKCYEVEVKEINKHEVTIYLREVLGVNSMAVTISKKSWEKLKRI